MRYVVMCILVALSYGCSNFTTEDAYFVAYNVSDNTVAAVVDGTEYEVPANKSKKFVIQLNVPTNAVGNNYGPSQVDKRVQVTVAFRNLATGELTTPISCDAGAKLTTSITYEVKFGRATTSCTTSYAY